MFLLLFFCVFSILCILYFCTVCLLFLLLYIAVSFLFLMYMFTDHCQGVDNQINIVSYHIGEDVHIGFIHSFSILSDDRSKASSKTMPPHSAIQSLLLQMRISSPVLKVIQ